ncbi:MAG TPA: tRNA epoxyqueuosine(34) reductase QueG [Gammaproteobacteria bacterium]|nr:tRNA epoxyqueuosine(34) reductase QueG [Gammaproteobacteria bacterium]
MSPEEIKSRLRTWACELGFDELRVTDTDVSAYVENHKRCIEQGLHGEMRYLERNQELRYYPRNLVPGTQRVICLRMNCLPPVATRERLLDKTMAYIARYALGRDYHKVMRKRLDTLARRLAEQIGPFGYRAFVDSAPVLERQLAEKSGLGWIGKNTLLLNEKAGSWFLLGEIYTDLPLPIDAPQPKQRCGTCTACLDICPTRAFIKPWVLDARRCISYLTIEFKGPIPPELRPLIGNRVFGCDDCQIFCPWTKFSDTTAEPAFQPRHGLDDAALVELFLWSEQEFLDKTTGSPIRRAGYEGWLRNLAIALGNAPPSPAVISALRQRLEHPSALVREHVEWALERHAEQAKS